MEDFIQYDLLPPSQNSSQIYPTSLTTQLLVFFLSFLFFKSPTTPISIVQILLGTGPIPPWSWLSYHGHTLKENSFSFFQKLSIANSYSGRGKTFPHFPPPWWNFVWLECAGACWPNYYEFFCITVLFCSEHTVSSLTGITCCLFHNDLLAFVGRCAIQMFHLGLGTLKSLILCRLTSCSSPC